jgi:hypothetical protein
VQQAQGGYLAAKQQWFFILPLALREEALRVRGQKGFGKLWPAIARLNQRFGLADRGHLEQLVCGEWAFLTQYQSRFELLPGQTGAMFFVGDRLAGLEVAPNPAYFEEVWMPLVCFCYGAAAMEEERRRPAAPAPVPFAATSLPELRARLDENRRDLHQRVGAMLARAPRDRLDRQEEERFLSLRLYTAAGEHFAGQFVEDDGRLVSASLAATPKHLYG